MAFGAMIHVQPMPDGTYNIGIHSVGAADNIAVLATSEHADMYCAILRALSPFLNDDFKKVQRVPLPRSRSLVLVKAA